MSNPATINGRLERNYESYLDEPNLTKRDTQPIPFETFVRKIAFRLRDETGSYKSNDAIEEELAELLDFMRVLMNGGVSRQEQSKTNLIVDQTSFFVFFDRRLTKLSSI